MKKTIAWLATLLLLVCFHLAEAQQSKKVLVIGILVSAGDPSSPAAFVETLRNRLRKVGYVEGKNVLIEYRYGEGKLERLPGLISELIQARPDVLVVSSLVGLRAAKQATKTIPIVMVTSADPVATGIIDNLARPGGNITGIALLSSELSAKRVELLTELIPRISRVGILWDADAPGPILAFQEYEAAAQAFKLDILSLQVHGPSPDYDGVFLSARKTPVGALIVVTNPLIIRTRKQIAELAVNNQLALVYENSRYIQDGGVMSYSANDLDQWARAATYVDKILKGAKPSELPVEQPTKFEFVINLKTAKQIGLTIPPNVLARADRVIK